MKQEVKNIKVINNTKESVNKRVRTITITALFAALITVMTAYICHIPIPGGYIHIGDSLIYLAAAILPMRYAMIAGAIGGGMADLLTYPMWAIPTMIIKALIVLPFSNKDNKITTKRNIIATVIAYVISGVCYYLVGALVFGAKTAFIVSMLQSIIQSGGSAVIFIILGIALDKCNFKVRIYNNGAEVK